MRAEQAAAKELRGELVLARGAETEAEQRWRASHEQVTMLLLLLLVPLLVSCSCCCCVGVACADAFLACTSR